MTAETLARIDATPFAGLFPWLGSLWRQLKIAVAATSATKEERELLHLIEFAGSRFGEPLLRSTNEDDLDDRLDDLVDSPDVIHCTALLARLAPRFLESESVSGELFAEAVGDLLTVARDQLVESEQMLDAWLRAQMGAAALIARHAVQGPHDLDAVRSISLTSADFPADVAELFAHALRASFCTIAFVEVITTGEVVAPWLAKALVERFLTSARQQLRLLASIPGITVDESIVPASERLDLAAIEQRHARARNTALRSLEAARARAGA